MDQNICQQLGITVNYKLLDDTRIKKGFTHKSLAEDCNTAEQTVKNILNGTSGNPQIISLAPMCRSLGLTVDQVLMTPGAEEIIEVGEKINDESVIALKETYEYVTALVNTANKTNMQDARSHYEQHHIEVINQYKAIIQAKDEQIDTLKKFNKRLFIVSVIIVAIFIILTTSILSFEIGQDI